MGLLYILLQNGRFSQPQKVKFRLPVRAYTSSMDRFRLEETLHTACRNSVWFGFGDCLKIAFLGPRTTIFSSDNFCLSCSTFYKHLSCLCLLLRSLEHSPVSNFSEILIGIREILLGKTCFAPSPFFGQMPYMSQLKEHRLPSSRLPLLFFMLYHFLTVLLDWNCFSASPL